MQAVSRRGLQVGAPLIHLCDVNPPPGPTVVLSVRVFLLQAPGRLLRSTKAANEAAYASIAGCDKVGPQDCLGLAPGRRRARVLVGVMTHPRQCRRLQAPMSRMETDQFINDRYQAIEDRLKVRARRRSAAAACARPPPTLVIRHRCLRRALLTCLPAAGGAQAPEPPADVRREGCVRPPGQPGDAGHPAGRVVPQPPPWWVRPREGWSCSCSGGGSSD